MSVCIARGSNSTATEIGSDYYYYYYYYYFSVIVLDKSQNKCQLQENTENVTKYKRCDNISQVIQVTHV